MKTRLLRFLLVMLVLFMGSVMSSLLKVEMLVSTLAEFMVVAIVICWIIGAPKNQD